MALGLYSKALVEVTVSPNSDLSSPHWKFSPPAFLPSVLTDEGASRFRLIVDTSGTDTIHTTEYASITMFMVQNLDPTNYVSLVFKNAAAATVTQRIAPGGFIFLTDVDPTTSPTLQANSADCLCEVAIVGDTE